MLLVIHNLPKTMRFYDVKKLILDKCGLDEIILDNFTLEGDYKRVTVGLADEGDAALLVRKINGLYIEGCQLFVEDVRQKKLTEQPYRPIENPHVPQLRPEKNVQYDKQDVRMAPQPMMEAQPMIETQPMIPMAPMSPVQMAYSNLPFYMSPIQTSYANYENQAAHGAITPQLQAAYYQTQIQQTVMENQHYSLPAYSSYPEKPQPMIPDDDPILKSRDSQWEERRRSRSSSPPPARFPVPDDEPQRRGRKQAVTISSHSERGRRSPERLRERSDKKSKRKESVRDRRERSPPRRRDESNRASRRDEDAVRSKHPSHIERSPPRDREFDTRRRDNRRQFDERERVDDMYDKRRALDVRDRERKRNSDRHEKPRDYDKLDESRYDKPVLELESVRDFGQKRPYTDVSQSSRTYGNDPDNCTFSVSNASIFEKQPNARESDSFRSNEGNTECGGFDHRGPAKRARYDLNKVASGPPKVDPSKTSILAPDMRKMILRHNNWRYQVASILAKQIMSAARGPGVFPNYPLIYKKLKECVVARIDVRLGDTIVRSLVEMVESYRSRFPPEDDVTFFNAVLEKIERDEKESAAEILREGDAQVEGVETVTKEASDIADATAKDADLMPPPPPQIRIPSNITPQPPFQNRASNATPPFQTTAPILIPQYQNTASTLNPQFQNTALSTSPTDIAANPNPYFQNTAFMAFQNTAPHPNPHYRNLPNPNPHFKNGIPTPRFQKRASPQLIQISPGNLSVPTPRMPTRSVTKANNRTLVPMTKVAITRVPITKVPTPKVPTPKVPMSRKEISRQKFFHKMEYQDDDPYDVEPMLKQAIEDEVALMVELYAKRPAYFMKNTDYKIFRTIVNETTDRFKKVVKLALTKRVLDIKTGLTLRIFPVSKWPNNQLFKEWMEKNGIVSVKKCPEMYVAVCDSFEAYDRLVEMGSFKVGDIKMEIKTLNVTGPRASVREKMREASYKQQVPGSSDLLVFDEDVEGAGIEDYTNEDEDINNKESEGIDDEEEDTHSADATEHDDVVIVEQEKEVVFIEDDDVTFAQVDAQGDERAELTERVDADNDGNNVESLEKGNEETTENVESSEEQYLEKREKSLETGEDTLEKGEDNLKQGEDNLEKGEDTLEKGEDTLEKDEDIQETSEVTLEKGEDTLEKSDYPLETQEKEFSLTGDNLEAEITDDIADDDLEDF